MRKLLGQWKFQTGTWPDTCFRNWGLQVGGDFFSLNWGLHFILFYLAGDKLSKKDNSEGAEE